MLQPISIYSVVTYKVHATFGRNCVHQLLATRLPLTPHLLARMMDVIKKEVVLPGSLSQLSGSLPQFPVVSGNSPARTKSSPVRTSPPRRNSMALPDTVNPASRVNI